MKWEKDVVLTVSLDQVAIDPGQPRKNKPLPYLRELGASILHDGQDHPCDCRVHPDDEKMLMLVNGECRYTSSVITEGLKTIDVVVKSKFDGMTAKEIYLHQMKDNAVRKNLDPMENVESFETAVNMGCDVAEIAGILGKSEATIRADLPLLKLPVNIRRAIDNNDLSKKVAREIASFDSDVRMNEAYAEARKCHGASAQVTAIEAYRQKKAQTSIDEFALAADENKNSKARKTLVKDFEKLQTAVAKFRNSPAGNGGGKAMVLACRKRPGVNEIEFMAQEMARLAEKIIGDCTLYRHTTTNPDHKVA